MKICNLSMETVWEVEIFNVVRADQPAHFLMHTFNEREGQLFVGVPHSELLLAFGSYFRAIN